ncbi:unnamed protein product [Rhizophagus irregularis]|nr:unnamed protein product [Rhizophagus irregularis]
MARAGAFGFMKKEVRDVKLLTKKPLWLSVETMLNGSRGSGPLTWWVIGILLNQGMAQAFVQAYSIHCNERTIA